MILPVEEYQTGSLGLRAVGLAPPCQVKTAWLLAGGSDLGYGMWVAEEVWSHFGVRLLHCSLAGTDILKLITEMQNLEIYKMCKIKKAMYLYQEVSFVLAVGDVFHVEGNDVFCMAS